MRKYVNKNLFLRSKIINLFMKNGKKKIAEKILVKAVKRTQKISKKQFKTVFQYAIINSTPIFVVNSKVVKKGKRKVQKDVPSFLFNNFSRVNNALKIVNKSIKKNRNDKHFDEILVTEMLDSFFSNSSSVIKKNEIQKFFRLL